MEFRFAPDSFVMSRGRVEHPSFSLIPYPGPRFRLGDVVILCNFANLQYGASFLVVVFVDVGFIPGGEFLDVFYCGMIRFDDGGGEILALVMGKFSANKFGESGLVAEAGAGAMNGNETAAFFYETGEVCELLRCDCFVIGVEEDAVEAGKILVIAQGFFDDALG